MYNLISLSKSLSLAVLRTWMVCIKSFSTDKWSLLMACATLMFSEPWIWGWCVSWRGCDGSFSSTWMLSLWTANERKVANHWKQRVCDETQREFFLSHYREARPWDNPVIERVSSSQKPQKKPQARYLYTSRYINTVLLKTFFKQILVDHHIELKSFTVNHHHINAPKP